MIVKNLTRKICRMMAVPVFVSAVFLGMANFSNATPGQGSPWTHGDWSSRVAWEARYALSQSANGVSNFQTTNDSYGQRWYGDWNYVASLVCLSKSSS